MRINRLTVNNVLGIRGRIDLDTRHLHGLIAITGPNGAGKTTLLEAMIAPLYRRWPSRGELARSSHVDPGSIVVEVEIDGQRYRASVRLHDRRSEAVLEREETPGDWVALNDGKVTSFDALIATLFPPFSVLMASAFAAQDRTGSFVRLDRQARKALFARLLGLERYAVLADRATAILRAAERQAAEWEGQTRAYQGQLEAVPTDTALTELIGTLQDRRERLRDEHRVLESQLSDLDSEMDQAATLLVTHAKDRAEVDKLETEDIALQHQQEALLQQREALVARLAVVTNQIQQHQQRIQQIDAAVLKATEVPCHAAPPYAHCPFLKLDELQADRHAATQALQGAEDKVQALHQGLKEALDALAAKR